MSAPQRLTDAQIAFARDIHRKRAEAYRRVRMFPTDEQLAEQLGCSRRYLQKILAGQARTTPPRPPRAGPSQYAQLSPTEKRKAIARGKANMAQFRGKLVPEPCEKCGAEQAEKHHDDYSAPLVVRWLCRSCHLAEHETSVKPNVELRD